MDVVGISFQTSVEVTLADHEITDHSALTSIPIAKRDFRLHQHINESVRTVGSWDTITPWDSWP